MTEEERQRRLLTQSQRSFSVHLRSLIESGDDRRLNQLIDVIIKQVDQGAQEFELRPADSGYRELE